MVAGAGADPYTVPVPFFLIAHEKGYVLFDTGHNADTHKDVRASVPDQVYNGFRPDVTEGVHVLDAIKSVGVTPEEIKYVVCSHLHFDHAGGMGYFPNASYIIQRAELHYAYVPDPFIKFAYFRQDFDRDLNWLFLEGWQDNRYDIFGDGKLIIYFTPGHTPGHQSLLVNLEKDGSFLLTSDACYSPDNLNNLALSSITTDSVAYMQNLRVFRDMRNRGINIFIAHDPEAWEFVKQAPNFYE